MNFKPTESRTDAFPIDSTGSPLIVQCPASGCEDLDLWTMEAAGGQTWIVVCGSGHMAFLIKKED